MRKLKHEEIHRPDPNRLDSLLKHPISVLVDNVRSIHNVGSIFRSSDASLVEKLYLTGISGTPENPALHKTALGAQDSVEWEYVQNGDELLRRLKDRGYTIAVLEITDEPTFAHELGPAHFPLVLVVGNELFGVSQSLIELADVALEIPQYGVKQSLNVSVAYGIAVFDLVRRYRMLKGLEVAPGPAASDVRRISHTTSDVDNDR